MEIRVTHHSPRWSCPIQAILRLIFPSKWKTVFSGWFFAAGQEEQDSNNNEGEKAKLVPILLYEYIVLLVVCGSTLYYGVGLFLVMGVRYRFIVSYLLHLLWFAYVRANLLSNISVVFFILLFPTFSNYINYLTEYRRNVWSLFFKSICINFITFWKQFLINKHVWCFNTNYTII